MNRVDPTLVPHENVAVALELLKRLPHRVHGLHEFDVAVLLLLAQSAMRREHAKTVSTARAAITSSRSALGRFD